MVDVGSVTRRRSGDPLSGSPGGSDDRTQDTGNESSADSAPDNDGSSVPSSSVTRARSGDSNAPDDDDNVNLGGGGSSTPSSSITRARSGDANAPEDDNDDPPESSVTRARPGDDLAPEEMSGGGGDDGDGLGIPDDVSVDQRDRQIIREVGGFSQLDPGSQQFLRGGGSFDTPGVISDALTPDRPGLIGGPQAPDAVDLRATEEGGFVRGALLDGGGAPNISPDAGDEDTQTAVSTGPDGEDRDATADVVNDLLGGQPPGGFGPGGGSGGGGVSGTALAVGAAAVAAGALLFGGGV